MALDEGIHLFEQAKKTDELVSDEGSFHVKLF